jgi:hypothetical protein
MLQKRNQILVWLDSSSFQLCELLFVDETKLLFSKLTNITWQLRGSTDEQVVTVCYHIILFHATRNGFPRTQCVFMVKEQIPLYLILTCIIMYSHLCIGYYNDLCGSIKTMLCKIMDHRDFQMLFFTSVCRQDKPQWRVSYTEFLSADMLRPSAYLKWLSW